jgi:hypothetical protein
MLKQVVHLALAQLLIFLVASIGFGQTTDGALTGKVIDASSAIVQGAAVSITNKDTGLKASITSFLGL